MPTHEEEPRFLREFARLTPQQRAAFLATMHEMVEDLRAGRPFRNSLRVKHVQRAPGVYEVTWEWPDGRATFHYGPERHAGDPHVVWRRIGGHEIFTNP